MSLPLPRISIVTPSLNQGDYLHQTIRSVLDQNYPNLEYVIVDGGSTDGSTNVISKYQSQLAYWVSEKDGGQYEAINKGFAKTSGEIMAWINSDDKYLPWTFSVVGEVFATRSEIDWITSCYPLYWDEAGRAVACGYFDGFNRAAFLRGEYMADAPWARRTWIMQECTFWRRSLWEKAGGRLETRWKLAADFELWARFYQHAELYGIASPLGGFRLHPAQASFVHDRKYLEEALAIFAQYHGRAPGRIRSRLIRIKGKLLTWLLRTNGSGLGPRPDRHICRHAGREGGWVIVR